MDEIHISHETHYSKKLKKKVPNGENDHRQNNLTNPLFCLQSNHLYGILFI